MRLATVVTGLIATQLAACARNEPPAPDGSPSIAQAEMPVAPPPTSIPTPMPASLPVPIPSAAPATLPQTRDMPHASGPAFEKRVAGLWEAIARDEPARAEPFFFPVSAYDQVKDVPNPGADWSHRLMSAYARDIHALHARLADGASRAKLVVLEVPDALARWVDPGEEYNKIGYFRVFGSKLRYEIDGERRSFDVKSLISWRGEWYVVHLSAIK